MASESEPAKLLLPYLQRADELQKHEPLVAYYCRLYAMERGLKIPASNRTKTTSALLVSLMNQLEKDKKSLTLGSDDHLHVEGFALNVFAKADKQDRAERADLNTAKTFYAASIFFEILNQFGEVHPELEQKQRYAVWKAADIRRALKEGRKPQPGPAAAEDKDLSLTSTKSSGEDESEQTNHDFTIRNNSSEASATVTQDSGKLSDSNSSQNLLNISRKSSSNFPTHSTSVDVSSPHNNHPWDNNQSYNLDISRQSSNIVRSPSMNVSSPHNYPSDNNQTQSFHQSLPPPINSQPYHHQQPYQPEHQQYPSHQEVPSYSYPNFQSYPSFTDSSIIPSSYSSYYQNPPNADVTYSPNYLSSVQYESTNGSVSQDSSANAPKYEEYGSNYQPPPEKISEAHKAARFAVGALAFDDVATAVEHLKKSLELLANPSVGN